MATPEVMVITGTRKGIGRYLSEYYLEREHRVVGCSRGDTDLAHDLYEHHCLDVANEQAVTEMIRGVASRFGRIDAVINNAGVLEPMAMLRDVEGEDFHWHLAVNVLGVFHGTRAFVRHRRGQTGEGVLINISSGAALRPYAGWSAYCASKAAVDRMTECVQVEEADSGLRAHAVAPGVIDTAMQELIRETPPERFPEVERFRRMKAEQSFNTPEFVARELLAIAFDPARRPSEVVLRLPSAPRAG